MRILKHAHKGKLMQHQLVGTETTGGSQALDDRDEGMNTPASPGVPCLKAWTNTVWRAPMLRNKCHGVLSQILSGALRLTFLPLPGSTV